MVGRLVVVLLLVGATVGASPLPQALEEFDRGDYEAVIVTLRSSVDEAAITDPVDRAQALRVYGLACFLTGRHLAAESAFQRWLRLDGRARLDPQLVRPEAVAFFEEVRRRTRDEGIREVERRRPRSAWLNLLPPAGQFQNGEKGKFGALLACEVALLGLHVATGAALYGTVRTDGTFPDPERAEGLRAVNWLSFVALGGAILYGVIDGFVVFKRQRDQLRREADSLRADLGAR